MSAMKLPETTDKLELRAAQLLQSHRELLYRRTDRLFAGLMAVQWLASLIAAYWIAPRTWEGLNSQTHPHVWVALFLGGMITLYPIILAVLAPGRVLTRHVIAVGQLLMSGLLIHLTGGRTETHFHIFGSLAFLAFYRDWRVLVTASVVTALDHGLRGYFWPESIYGIVGVGPWRSLEHIGWVIFTDIFLIVSIAQSVREMKDTAWRQAKQEFTEASLEQAREHLEIRVQQRTSELARVNAALEQDITERERAETALRDNEQQLRIALESGKLGSFLIEISTGQTLAMSDICRHHFGLSLTAESSVASFFQAIHPSDLDRVQNAYSQAIDNWQDYEAEFRFILSDGPLRWISVHGCPIYSEADNRPRMIGVTQDITERKQLELEREQELAEALERANRDSLTNLLNHRAFQMHLEQEVGQARNSGTNLALVVLDIDNFKFFNDCYGHTIGDEVLQMTAAALQSTCRPQDLIARFGGDEFALILPDVGSTHASDIEAKLRADLRDLTFITEGVENAIPITLSIGSAVFPQSTRNRLDLLLQADERLMMDKTGSEAEAEAKQVRASALRRVQGFSMLDALVTAVDNKDRYTRRHSEDVMTYSVQIAQELGLNETMQHTIAVAALLHDVGKIGVPDAILRKPGKLTEDEFEAVKQHPQMGAMMVATVPGLEGMLDAIRHHHEQWDGGGYPFGLVGKETPQIARLMAVADAFSAMTTDRPYRKGMHIEKALLILESGAGTQWDPVCVKAFLNAQNRRKRQSLLPLRPRLDEETQMLEELEPH